MKKCIVSFGKNYNFEKGIDRLEKNIRDISDVPFFGYKEYPKDSPTHEESPFSFKFYCINECIQKGYSHILWLDSSVIIKNPIDDVFKLIDNLGYFFVANSHNVGQYCHDRALKTLNITREESFRLWSLQGTNFGLNMNIEICQKFLNKMLEYSKDGITFVGPHNNDNKFASQDQRVLGHRHEQTAMSVEAIRLNMINWKASEKEWFIHDREYVKNVISTVSDIDMS
jgi:lipopolysaccharide biosynthesis glycosyltransferase